MWTVHVDNKKKKKTTGKKKKIKLTKAKLASSAHNGSYPHVFQTKFFSYFDGGMTQVRYRTIHFDVDDRNGERDIRQRKSDRTRDESGKKETTCVLIFFLVSV